MTDSASTSAANVDDASRLPAEFNTARLRADIFEVLCEHGFSPRLEDVTVKSIVQGGYVAGVSITASVYERPADLGPAWTREEYDAWIGSAFKDLTDDAPESEVVA